jgi:hypothetical protein
VINRYEPRHYKTNIKRLRPAWIQTSLRIVQSDQDPCWSLSVSVLVIGFVSEQHGSSDCADAIYKWMRGCSK